MRNMLLIALLTILILITSGCVRPLSKDATFSVNWDVDYAQVKANPDAYLGKKLLLGGLIADNVTTKEGSLLIIVKYKLNRWDKPTEPDHDAGRLLAKSQKLLDPAIYETGRLVTLTGTLVGLQSRPLGETTYDYPAFDIGEIYLWAKDYTMDPFYYPHDPYYPYRYRYGHPYWHRWPYWRW